MKTFNPLLTRQVAKASVNAVKPRNTVVAALKNRHGGAGAHRKSHGALRRAENMAVVRALIECGGEGDDHA
jgi:hypothetical protein